MGIFNRKKRSGDSNCGFLLSEAAYETLCCSGYTRLSDNPEILTGCRMIASSIADMTIYLMSNTEKGDMRIKNGLSRKIDIEPNRYMTRKVLIEAIVMNLLLYGNGNSVAIPKTERGYLGDIVPIAPSRVAFVDDGYGYKVVIDGKNYNPDNLLHFVYNPDEERPWMGKGFRVAIKDVANNLKQASATEKGFLESKWKPSMVIKVDAMTEAFSSKSARKKFKEEWIADDEAGEPMIIPAEQFAVEQIKPLTLNDLAIKDTVELNKRTVAAILGVPPFVLGVGDFDPKAWNNFINTTVKAIAGEIEQELTRKLIISEKWYFKFNINSLYEYDLEKIANIYKEWYTRGLVTGNEARDKISLSPKDGLDELVILENFIKLDDISNQGKLVKNKEDEE